MWLKVEAGSQLMSEQKLTGLRAGHKQRKRHRAAASKQQAGGLVEGSEPLPGEPTGQAGGSHLSKGPGETSASRW